MAIIEGTDGERIRLLLGENGKSYLLIFNEDDGKRKWQTTFWSNIPIELSKQIKKIQASGRHISDVSFGTDDRWYVCGKRWDGSGSYHRWGGCSDEVSEAIAEWTMEPRRLQVAFGKEEQTFLQLGSNSYWDAGFPEVDPELSARMEHRQGCREQVHFVRLFPFYDEKDSYYRQSFLMRDSDGIAWNGNLGEHLEKELESDEVVHDVAIAGDGTWCVIRDSTFILSTGVIETIDDQISSFFARQKQRREKTSQKREKQIESIEAQNVDEILEPETRDRQENVRSHLENNIMDRREAEEKELYEVRKSLLRNFTIGSRVTTLGSSRNEGDGIIKALYTGPQRNCVTVEHDDKRVLETVDPMEVRIFKIGKHKQVVLKNYRDVLSKRRRWQQREREFILAHHAEKYGMFLWRGLHDGETGKGIFAKDPTATMDMDQVLATNKVESQYIHLTRRPEVAICYSAAYSKINHPWRVAQIDLSKVDVDSIYDVSKGAGLNAQAAELAKSHEVVLIREHIPARAITIRTITPHFTVPKTVDETFKQFLPRLKEDELITSTIRRWKLLNLEKILKAEFASYPVGENDSKFSSHLLLLARLVSENAETENEMSIISKQILCHGEYFNRESLLTF